MRYANPVDAELVNGNFYEHLAKPYYLSPEKIVSDYAEVRFARERRIFRRHCRRGRVLDVGCSTGGFLHSLNRFFPRDYDILGMDVAGPALDHAESMGVPVIRESFLETSLEPNSFDAVTFWAVLEHLDQPHAFLTQAASVLKAGGHCFVLVPNLNSLAIRLLGPRYRYVMIEHLNYFSRRTLTQLTHGIPEFEIVGHHSTHFNPVVLWQDWRSPRDRVPDAERARLLSHTTHWKESAALAPARWIYSGVEWLLGKLVLADNLVIVLRRG
jgi:2-polyprenyl-3-methyl-5-hydroxy-6-metoxy-1,4-benzoquinol methylase